MSWLRSIALRTLLCIEELIWHLDQRVGFFNIFKKRARHIAGAGRGHRLYLALLLPLLAASEHYRASRVATAAARVGSRRVTRLACRPALPSWYCSH